MSPHRKLPKDERMEQSRNIVREWQNGVPYQTIAEHHKLPEKTICRIIDHHCNDGRSELSHRWSRAFIANQCIMIIRNMQPGLQRGSIKAANVVIKASERYARLAGADAPTQTQISGDGENPIQIVGRIVWRPPTDK